MAAVAAPIRCERQRSPSQIVGHALDPCFVNRPDSPIGPPCSSSVLAMVRTAMAPKMITMPISDKIWRQATPPARSTAAGRTADDRCRPPVPVLKKVAGRVLELGLWIPIVLADHEHDACFADFDGHRSLRG